MPYLPYCKFTLSSQYSVIRKVPAVKRWYSSTHTLHSWKSVNRNSLFHNFLLSLYPQYTTTKCGEQTVVLCWSLNAYGIHLTFYMVIRWTPQLSVMNWNIIIMSHLSQCSTSLTLVLSLFFLLILHLPLCLFTSHFYCCTFWLDLRNVVLWDITNWSTDFI